jgi:ankyrin repeat protein
VDRAQHGNTPLHCAVASGCALAIKLLLARKADKTAKNKVRPQTWR